MHNYHTALSNNRKGTVTENWNTNSHIPWPTNWQ